MSCLFAAYPLESISYQMGDCPAVDVCKERLEVCKAIYSSGNDETDCGFETIDHCFYNADRCVDIAVKNCKEDPPSDISDLAPPPGWCDGFFFMFISLFAGTLFYSSKPAGERRR